jgi:hypothetical protein
VRRGELKNKSVYVPNKQRTGALSNGPKACEVVGVTEGEEGRLFSTRRSQHMLQINKERGYLATARRRVRL